MNNPIKLYRVQHPSTNHGMWNTHCDKGNALVTYLSNQVMATLPMPHSEAYVINGRRAYASVQTKEHMAFWFNDADMQELIDFGFRIFSLMATEYAMLDHNEVVFTKESSTDWQDVTHEFGVHDK